MYHQGSSKLFISKYLSLSRNTVKKYIALYQLLNLKIEDINQRTDAELEDLFCNSKTQTVNPKLQTVYDFFLHGTPVKKNRCNQANNVAGVL